MLRKRSPLGNGGLSQGQEKGATFQDPAGGLVQTRRRGRGSAAACQEQGGFGPGWKQNRR